MIALALLASMALSPATDEAFVVEGNRDRIDVGYAELAAGYPQAAIERIHANRRLEADDPAALINLGTASARLGRPDVARRYYIAAIASTSRYDLELSDGRWMDSRRAARTAIRYMKSGETLAVR